MVVHLAEGAGEIKLVGEAELITDLFDGPFSGVEQLHRALHPQMVQIIQGRIPGRAPKRGCVVRARKIHQRGQRRYRQWFLKMTLHEYDALGDPFAGIDLTAPELVLVPQDQAHQVRQRMRCVNQMRQR